MSQTTIEQSTQARFPDRGSVGVRIALGDGGQGWSLAHKLASPLSVCHARLAVGWSGLLAGTLRVLEGHTDLGELSWWVTM